MAGVLPQPLRPEYAALTATGARAAPAVGRGCALALQTDDFDELVQAFEQAGVEVAAMSQEQFNTWLDLAQESSYKVFAEEVPGGEQLIEKALAVE